MIEPTRPQQDAADAMALKHGSCRVDHLPPGHAVLLTGLRDDRAMERMIVAPNGWTDLHGLHYRAVPLIEKGVETIRERLMDARDDARYEADDAA